jgi:hypothetical protein
MEAAKDAHAIAILTEWDEFKEYDYQKVRAAAALLAGCAFKLLLGHGMGREGIMRKAFWPSP